MNKYKQIGVVCIVAIVAFFLGYVTHKNQGGDFYNVSSKFDSTMVDLSEFWDVWNVLDEKFVGASTTSSVSVQEKLWAASEGLARVYKDPYTVFLPPESTKQLEEAVSGTFTGVGMEVGRKDDLVSVITPIKGSPAYNAGVKPGDIILKINNKPINHMPLDEAIKLIRGQKGTEVTITFVRLGYKNNEPFDLVLKRDEIKIPTIETEKKNDVFVIHLYNFSALSEGMFREAMREFYASGVSRLIVDVRGNPGGFLDSVTDISSWFLPHDAVVVREHAGKKKDKLYVSKGYTLLSNKKIAVVVLVNGGSASASEILAGALSDHKKATVVGSQTYGKGSVQEVVPLQKGTSVKVTVAQWLTPSGITISEKGLTPHVVVSDNYETKEDEQMQKALEVVRRKPLELIVE